MNNLNFPSIKELLAAQSQRLGNKTFLKYIKDGEICEKSFNTVYSDTLAFSRMIRHKFVKKTNIALIGETGYEYIISLLGILTSGCAVVPFSPEISVAEIKELFDDADIEAVVYDSNFAKKAEVLKAVCPSVRLFLNVSRADYFQDIMKIYSESSKYSSLSDDDVDKDECAAIIYTSGTTGFRKGVMLSTNSLVGNIMYKDFCTDIFRENDVILSVLPMYHIYCFTGDIIKNLKDGLQVCLNGSMREITKNLKVFQPRVMRVVPMIAETLLRRMKLYRAKHPSVSYEEAANHVFGENIKYLISGGAYLNSSLVDEYAKYGILLCQGYGMTEAGCRISVPDEDVDPASVGRIIDICEVRTQNGEIQVKTPTRMIGYYNMPEETEKIFTPDGWLKTGDLGYVTDDRQLFITGRVKNLIILSSGENVSPEAIEKKFAGCEIIKEVMVYAENNMIAAEFYPDFEYAQKHGINDINRKISEITDALNSKAKSSHFISKILIRDIPFDKTGSGKIKRKENTI